MHFFSLLVGESRREDKIVGVVALGILFDDLPDLALEIAIRCRSAKALAIEYGLSGDWFGNTFTFLAQPASGPSHHLHQLVADVVRLQRVVHFARVVQRVNVDGGAAVGEVLILNDESVTATTQGLDRQIWGNLTK